MRATVYWSLSEHEPGSKKDHLRKAVADFVEALRVAPKDWAYTQIVRRDLQRVRQFLGEEQNSPSRLA